VAFGFELSESLSGSWYRLDDPTTDRAIRYTLKLGVAGLRRFMKERKLEAKGTIFIEGLAEGEVDSARGITEPGRPLFGTIVWRLIDEKRVPYDLELQGDDGKHYRLRGQRDFFLHDAVDSLTILPASIYDESGAEIGRATLRYDPRMALPATLKSIRPRLFVKGA
jgi:hypothetical protein